MSADGPIVALLAKLPEDQLRRMRAQNLRDLEEKRARLARLRVELEMFEEAAERRAEPQVEIAPPKTKAPAETEAFSSDQAVLAGRSSRLSADSSGHSLGAATGAAE